jgi:hypothetical protein
MENENENENKDINRDIKEKKKKKDVVVVPPLRIDVINYCKERNNGINADTFIDFYTARGWIIGKNKMKDWRAAIRTWEQRNKDKPMAPAAPISTGQSPRGGAPYMKPNPAEQAKVAKMIRQTTKNIGINK